MRMMFLVAMLTLGFLDADTMGVPSKKQYIRIKGSGHQHGLERTRFIAGEPSEA